MDSWWATGREALEMLRTPLGIKASRAGEHFDAIFGRDSLWTLMLVLEAARLRPQDQEYRTWAYELGAAVLRGLAKLQGSVENDLNEEQPGKIVHEYWDPIPDGLRRACWPMVDGRYYGAVDATFLYLIAIHQFYQMFRDEHLLDELWASVKAALDWAFCYSDVDQDGLVEYQRRNPLGHGLLNQVWKDSWDAVMLPGELAVDHPITWLELQGYAFRAYTDMRILFEQHGELTPALDTLLTGRIHALQAAMNLFWAEDGYPGIALDKHKKLIKVVSSNAGHLLWSAAVDNDRAELIARRLTQPDILTDWGIRTLSQHAYYYNPLIYHRGTIWPFDNAVTVLGLERYGFLAEAHLIAASVMRAIKAFSLPVELYCVIPAHWIREPRIEQEWLLADYPQSCTVQAWTAAAVLYFTALLERP